MEALCYQKALANTTIVPQVNITHFRKFEKDYHATTQTARMHCLIEL